MNLYWVTTPEGYENWFVFARTKILAEKFHEYAEGFNANYATAELVCRIPKALCEKYKLVTERFGWPSNELLQELGGRFDTEDNPRVINFFGQVFIEGSFIEGIFFDEIKFKSGVYVIKVQNSKKYKIGVTTNIKRRIKQFATGNPFNLKLLYFVETLHYKSLEKHLHNVFKRCRIKGEWFDFEDIDFEELEYLLAYIAEISNEFIVHDIKSASIQRRVN